jgi:hypothetical protein
MRLPLGVFEAPGNGERHQLFDVPPEPPGLMRALELADNGYEIFPLKPEGKVPLTVHGFKDATRDSDKIRAWWKRWPDANIGIACGASGIIVADLDVKGGGKGPENWEQLVAGVEHQAGFSVTTPSGGLHLIWRGSGVPSSNGVLARSVDIKAERGYIVAAGSTSGASTYRPSQGGPLPRIGDLPPASEALKTVQRSRRATKTRPPTESDRRTTVPQRNAPSAGRTTLADLLANPPASGQRNEWLTKVAGHYADKLRGQWAAYAQAVRASNALLASPLDASEVDKVIESIKTADIENHGEGDSKDSPTVRVINYARDQYDFYSTPEGEVFATAKSGNRRPVLMGESGSGAIKSKVTADLFERDGKVPGAHSVEDALRVIYAQTVNSPSAHVLDLRVAERPGMLVLDLAEPGSGRCVVVTPDGWEVRDNPPQGVLFRLTRTTKPIPAPSRDGDLDLLRVRLTWEANDPRWIIVSGWLVASCLPSIPRPLLAFTGQPGSAKTTRARLVLSVIDPRNELGSSFGKNEGDEQAMAGGRYLVGWDNISRTGDEVSDRLCRVVTGEESVKRKLYTDSDQSVISFRRTGAITAVTLPTLRADALERLIPVACDRIEGRNRQSEAKIRDAFDADHPRILGGLMDSLVRMLGNLEVSRDRDADRVRMADFQDALHALDPQVADVYAESVKSVMVEAAEADPFVSAVMEWLASQAMPLTLQTKQAWHDASAFRERLSPGDPEQWWPKSATAFSKLLLKNTEPLHALGVQVDYSRRTKHGRQLVFFRPGQTESLELNGSSQ